MSLHCNAGGGQGFESYVYTKPSAASVSYQNVIHSEVMAYLKGYGIVDRGKKRANLAVCRETRMPAVLLECLFIDNLRENQLLRDDSFLRGLAAAISKGIINALGLKQKTTKQVEQTKAKYRLLTGTFASRQDAEEAAEKLRQMFGWTVYVQEEK